MKKDKSVFMMLILLGLVLACNMPLSTGKLPEQSIKTAQHLATDVAPTLFSQPAQSLTQEIPNLSVAATMLAQTNQAFSQSPSPQDNVISTPIGPVNHTIFPGEPEKVLQTVYDFNSQPFAEQKRTNGDYYDLNLFERPFNAQMIYRGDADIQKVEFCADKEFYYYKIYLANLSDSSANNDMYGLEIDTDIDGRGDYLVWINPPKTNSWNTDGVSLYSDADGDVGGKNPLKSDAPINGNGYEKLLTSTKNMIDPDALWSRRGSNNSNSIQIALKIESIKSPNSFMWSAWADGAIKAPNMFDYNDAFTIQNAGSPIKDDKNYPLNNLHTLDNTCRGLYGRPATGIEPGLCGDMNKQIKTLVPQVTLPALPQMTTPINIPIP